MADYLIQKDTLTDICDQIRLGFGIVPQEHPMIKAEFIEEGDDQEGTLIQGAVNQTYYMGIDSDFSNSNGNIVEYPRVGSILAYRYEENNEGNIVPVLFYDRQDYGEPDWYQPMYYDGVEEINGEMYDRWRGLKLGNNDEGYTDNGDELDWDDQGQIYYYTNQIVEAGAPMEYYSPTEIPDKLDELFITPKGQLMKCNVISGVEIEKNSYVKLSPHFGSGSVPNTASATIEGVYKLSETKIMIFYYKKVQVDYDLNVIVATLSEGKVTFKTYMVAQEYSIGSAAALVLNSNTFLLVKADRYSQSFYGQIYSINDNGITSGTSYTIENVTNVSKSFLHRLNQNKAVLVYDKQFAVLTFDSSTKAISVSHTSSLSQAYGTITSIGVTDNNKLWVLDNQGDCIAMLCYLITDSSIVLLESYWLTDYDDEIEYSQCYASLNSTSDGKIIVASSWKETDMYDESTWYAKYLRAFYYNAETENILLKNYALVPSTNSSVMENPKIINIDNNSSLIQWGLSPYTLALMTHKNVQNSYTLTSTADQEYNGFPVVLGNNSILVFHSGNSGIYYHSFYIFDETTIIQHNNEPGIYASLASYYDNNFDGIAKVWGDDTEPILVWVKNAEKWQ